MIIIQEKVYNLAQAFRRHLELAGGTILRGRNPNIGLEGGSPEIFFKSAISFFSVLVHAKQYPIVHRRAWNWNVIILPFVLLMMNGGAAVGW